MPPLCPFLIFESLLILSRELDGEELFGPETFQDCDYTASYKTLSDLNMAIAGQDNPSHGTMRSDCVAAYALDTLITMLDTAYDNYTVINQGYNEEFDFYVKYMKKTVPSVIDNELMFDTSNETPTEAIPPLGPLMKCKSQIFAARMQLLKLIFGKSSNVRRRTQALAHSPAPT